MSDPLFSNVSLLLQFNTDGSTTVDSSSSGKIVSLASGAVVSSTASKWGAASLRFPSGTGGFPSCNVDGSTDFDFGTGNFTVEFWYKADDSPTGDSTLMTYGDGLEEGWHIYRSGNQSGFVVHTAHAGNSQLYAQETAGVFTPEVWHHIAVVRDNGVLAPYFNGVRGEVGDYLSTGVIPVASDPTLRIGGNATIGYFDDVRITKGVARYSGSSFSVPSAQFELGAPAAASANASIIAPKPTVAASATGAASSAGIAAVSIELPSPLVYSVGHDSSGENAALIVAPAFSVKSFCGGSAQIVAKSPLVAAAATTINVGSVSAVTKPAVVTATATAATSAAAAVRMPMPSLVGYGGAVVNVTLPGKFLVASGVTVGSVGRVVAVLPLFEVKAEASRPATASAALVMPSPLIVKGAVAYITAPGVQLTAIGSAVVAVTYEAYALNLKHQDPESPDELTRYTNYPFDKIVRYQNSYFGVNATGLYLLEGTTDFAEPTPTKVPWAFKTGMTDFESANLKSVNWAYFGGRMAPAATISIHYGDTGAQNYAYATPRGASAQNYRQAFGRGIKSRYYAFEAAGVGELSLDSMLFDIAKSARKV